MSKKQKMEISDAVDLTPSRIKVNDVRMAEFLAAVNRLTDASAEKCREFLELVAKSTSRKQSEGIVVDAWNGQMTESDFIKVSMAHSEKWATKAPPLNKRKPSEFLPLYIVGKKERK